MKIDKNMPETQENMRIWDQVKTPPPEVLKKIKGGRLRGMTDISPQWRLQKMTELFGVVGEGWKYTIDQLWTADGSDEQVCAFARVSVYYKLESERPPGSSLWSAPIPGIGGSMLIAKETGGLHTSDEAYKMAVTDALSVAMKAMGLGADIYFGKTNGKTDSYDHGSKYQTTDQTNSDDESLPWILDKPCPACGFKELNIWNKDWGAGTYAYCKKKDGGCGAKFKTEEEIKPDTYRRDRLVDAISDIETKSKQQKKHSEFKAVIEKSFPGTKDWLTAGLPTAGLQVLVDLLAPASLKKELEESISKEKS